MPSPLEGDVSRFTLNQGSKMYTSANSTPTGSSYVQPSAQGGDVGSEIDQRLMKSNEAVPPFRGEYWIPSDLNAAGPIQSEIESVLTAFEFPEDDIFAIRMALEEARVNAIKHGNQMDPDKSVRVVYRVHPERFDVRITDQGQGFDPRDVPDPTAPENLERPCGRGLLLMRHYMTHVCFDDRGSTIAMFKWRTVLK
jgi:serine/threonine-protein kinase RsbW